jgi:hypothetical protein
MLAQNPIQKPSGRVSIDESKSRSTPMTSRQYHFVLSNAGGVPAAIARSQLGRTVLAGPPQVEAPTQTFDVSRLALPNAMRLGNDRGPGGG